MKRDKKKNYKRRDRIQYNIILYYNSLKKILWFQLICGRGNKNIYDFLRPAYLSHNIILIILLLFNDTDCEPQL